MKERQSRLKAIKTLIKDNIIESQDDLLALLLKEGYEVTQAIRLYVCPARRR